MTTLPRVVIAAPGSGSGKTMLTTGILAALARRGVQVSPHKVGPDYIDPGYHAAACGRVGRNLDPHLQGVDRVVPLLLHGALTPSPADVAVIEGVMGLFDGQLGGRGFASTAHIATLTASPVVLVVDGAHTSRSVGATVLGFSRFDPQVRIAGVILNNIASPRHEAEARQGIEETGIPVVGCVPRVPSVVVPSRHLGLVPAAERSPEAQAAVEALADMVEAHVDLDELLAIARRAPDLVGEPWSPEAELGDLACAQPGSRGRVAVAGGRAFTFAYAETTELLAAAGLEPVVVDPLLDPELPEDVGGLVVGGGFPEVHATELAANTSLLTAIRELAEAGAPISGECAGLLYLGQTLDGHRMAGVLPTHAEFGSRLTLGYRSAVALGDSVLAPAGTRVTGHEFHRTRITRVDGEHQPAWAWTSRDGGSVAEGVVQGQVHASYLHLHWAGQPALARAFVSAVTGR
ncbi:cobyrinate a,c-diamide synthase [Arsenicicoccus dermatophilus]|uniref:cobyrinate a,c-diamide synthase n=1 Tax=Arsenicicoccus dermatophilus TaxID=1076331 RepID=UPI0039173775